MKDITIPMGFFNDCMDLPVSGKGILELVKGADEVRLCSEGILAKFGDNIKLFGFNMKEMRVHPKKLYTTKGVEVDPLKIEYQPIVDTSVRKLLSAMVGNLLNEICDDALRADKVFVISVTWLEALHWGYKIVRTIISKANEHHKVVIFVDEEKNEEGN